VKCNRSTGVPHVSPFRATRIKSTGALARTIILATRRKLDRQTSYLRPPYANAAKAVTAVHDSVLVPTVDG